MDDTALIGRCLDGDESSFELLVRRYTEDLWRLARSILRDDHFAEEAVQDAFVKAYRNLGSFRGDASVKTWLLSICYRTCMDRARIKRHPVVSLDAARAARSRRDDADLRIAVEAALGALPQTQLQAFRLVHVFGFSREEAAEIAGVPASTMRARVAKAKEKLAASLGTGDVLSEG